MPFPTISRRSGILLGALSLLVVIAVLHAGARNHPAYLSWPPASDVKNVPLVHKDEAVRRRFDALVNLCAADDPFELEYGRTNLRLSRGYEGASEACFPLTHPQDRKTESAGCCTKYYGARSLRSRRSEEAVGSRLHTSLSC